MRELSEYQSATCLLHAICDGCGEKREALLHAWVILDDSGNVSERIATMIHLLEDPLIRGVFAKDASGKDIDVLMHFEEFTDKEREIRFMQYIRNLEELFKAGLYTFDEAYTQARDCAQELNKDIQKGSCGVFDFYDAAGGRLLDFPHIIETCDSMSMLALSA